MAGERRGGPADTLSAAAVDKEYRALRQPWHRELPLVVSGTAATTLLAIVGAFFVPTDLVPYVSAGYALALLAALVTYQVGLATRRARSAAAPAVAWILVAAYLFSARPEGDLVLAASWPGVITLLLGSTAVATAVGKVPAGVRRADAREAERAAAAAAAQQAAAEAAAEAASEAAAAAGPAEPDTATGPAGPAAGGERA